MRLVVFILLDVDHAVDHAYRCGPEHVVTHLIATKLIAGAAGERRRVRAGSCRGS